MGQNLELLTRLLPQNFPFYHLGEVSLSKSGASALSPPLPDDRIALGFTLRGDLQAALILRLDPGLDLSVYSEVGNIIASRLVTDLADQSGIDVVLSPPLRLTPPQLDLIVKSSTARARRMYTHRSGEARIELEFQIYVSELPSETRVAVQEHAPPRAGEIQHD